MDEQEAAWKRIRCGLSLEKTPIGAPRTLRDARKAIETISYSHRWGDVVVGARNGERFITSAIMDEKGNLEIKWDQQLIDRLAAIGE